MHLHHLQDVAEAKAEDDAADEAGLYGCSLLAWIVLGMPEQHRRLWCLLALKRSWTMMELPICK